MLIYSVGDLLKKEGFGDLDRYDFECSRELRDIADWLCIALAHLMLSGCNICGVSEFNVLKRMTRS
jgi:hypothetical protein